MSICALILFGLTISAVQAIDPEYSWNNRINSFLTASLNSFLSVTKADEKPLGEDVTFWCVNREHREYTQTLINDPSLTEKINFSLPLVFLIHGWFDSKDRNWIYETIDDYLLYHDTNICVVDWNRLALQSYAISAKNTKKVGHQLAKFITATENKGMHLNDVTLVGHSFGSHVSGYAGAALGGRLNAIFALDPAGPRFAKKKLNPPNERLDPTDAQFVQAIHTDRTNIGADWDLGHQDFYPNGGESPMPGCYFPAVQTGIHPSQFLCSHFKAVEYFRAALNPENKFIGKQCEGPYDLYEIGLCDENETDTFGIYARRRARGRFYLTVSEDFPFTFTG
ncbi:lipase member H-like [Culicoides brevitarsis]|uniref:lipase member H-like n=1 Tax=Culicoides brevitarsis TaxID=469753 RepID=UPI00307B7B4D